MILDPLLFEVAGCVSGLLGLQEGSNWLPCGATPRCTPERLARQIFEYHTRDAEFDESSSGAEWWTQVLYSLTAPRALKIA